MLHANYHAENEQKNMGQQNLWSFNLMNTHTEIEGFAEKHKETQILAARVPDFPLELKSTCESTQGLPKRLPHQIPGKNAVNHFREKKRQHILRKAVKKNFLRKNASRRESHPLISRFPCVGMRLEPCIHPNRTTSWRSIIDKNADAAETTISADYPASHSKQKEEKQREEKTSSIEYSGS